MWHVGVHSYLLKNARPEEALQAVRTVPGVRYYPTQITATIERLLNAALYKNGNGNGLASFTDKELRRLKLLCESVSQKQIADRVGPAHKNG